MQIYPTLIGTYWKIHYSVKCYKDEPFDGIGIKVNHIKGLGIIHPPNRLTDLIWDKMKANKVKH